MSSYTSSSFQLLDPRVQKWIWNQGWGSLKDIQENSIPIVLKRDSDVIISAATAGGKTEAAFLPILTNLLKHGKCDGFQVLYISTLKALINDQYRRISDMTEKMGIDVIPWHGDVDASRKQRSLKNPSGIVIITPESLESFLINRKQYLSRAFSSLYYVVIDELHSLIGTERGKQLQSLLSRIENIANKPIPRVAMSATFSDYAIVEKFLRPDGTMPCKIPTQGDSNHEIKILVKEYITSKEYLPQEDIAKELYSKLRGSNNLIFANSRQDVEQYAVFLSDLCEANFVPNEFRVHHGNLSKIEREGVEDELQKGEFPVTAVCTATLELGVDIGKVKSIAQIGTAFSVAGLRQRLGRSGRRGEPSILRVFSIESSIPLLKDLRSSLVQNIAIIELLKEKCYETPSLTSYHFSTLIQQILSLLAQYGAFQPKEGWVYLCQKGAFRNVSVELFLELLRSLGSNNTVNQIHSGQIVIGLEGERIVRNIDFYTAFMTSVDYTLINKANSKLLGTIQYLPKIDDVLIFAGRRWSVDSINNDLTKKDNNIYVSQIKHGGAISFSGDGFDIDRLITDKMYHIYSSDEEVAYLDVNAKSELNIGRIFFKGNFLRYKFISYGSESVFFTWAGTKINRTISLILNHSSGYSCLYNHLALHKVTANDIKNVVEKGKPAPLALAALEQRFNKEKQKYDYLLSDKLLDLEYANTYLDIDEAWNILIKTINTTN